MFTLAVVYKIYAALAIFYLFVFISKLKNYFYELVTNKKSIFIFLILVSMVTFSKNIIQSGCFNFPVVLTCFDKNEIKWSAGKEISEWRNEVLKAGVKGWIPYVRENHYKEKIFPKDYNEQFKYSFHQNVFKDPDTEKILIVLLICLIAIFLNFFSKKKNLQNKKPTNFNFFILCSVIPAILWFWLMPYIRYGGYAYLPFSLIILYYSLTSRSYHLFTVAKCLLIIGIIYFLSKNIFRIQDELASIKNPETIKSFPIPTLENFNNRVKQINDNKRIYISSHNWWCGNVPLPCLPGFWENMEVNIKEKYGYLFVFVNEKEYMNFQIEKMKIYNLNKDRYNNDFNQEIRVK